MKDRVPTKPNRYAVYDDSHNLIGHQYHERADEPTEVGTPLNKATLLSDNTAAALGLTVEATVDDALGALGDAVNGLGSGTCATSAATAAKVGVLSGFVLSEGAMVAIRFTYANTASAPTLNVNGTGAKAIRDYRTYLAPARGTMAAGTHFFVYNGTYWVLLNPVGAQIANGSYTGTGTHGSGNANTLTFSFVPKAVFISASKSADAIVSSGVGFSVYTLLNGVSAVFGGSSIYALNVSWSGNSVSWYAEAISYQFNKSGISYRYVAIG